MPDVLSRPCSCGCGLPVVLLPYTWPGITTMTTGLVFLNRAHLARWQDNGYRAVPLAGEQEPDERPAEDKGS